MGTSSKAKISFDGVPKDNQALAVEIHGLVQKSRHNTSTLSRGVHHEEPDETQLKSLLERLYVSIVDFRRFRGKASTTNTKILAAWESFFEPIRALSQIRPHGHMMAARMILYLTNAFLGSYQLPGKFLISNSSIKPIALLCNFLTALDDALLSYLTHIWSHGDKREVFSWVFAEYAVHDCRADRLCYDQRYESASCSEALHAQRKNDRMKAACVTRPNDLTPENGVQHPWKWTRQQGDTTIYPKHPDCRRAGYERPRNRLTEPLLMWQDIGSDGPIRGSYHYTLVEDISMIHGQWRERHTLRRSRQFVLDARNIAMANLARDRHRLAVFAMARSPLPVELQLQVLGYLEDIPEHPYLSKLDLAAVYQPFPDIGTKCTECPTRSRKTAERMVNGTCPQKTITVWSLPLRMFHKFHLNNGNWTLCIHSDCHGHHSEATWASPSQGGDLEGHLNEVLQGRCGPETTIRSVGLGPLEPVGLPTQEEDSARSARLFPYIDPKDYENQDRQYEDRWKGINGLVDVMLHGRTLTNIPPGGWRRASIEPSWMLGRTRQEEQKVYAALKHGPPRCHYC